MGINLQTWSINVFGPSSKLYGIAQRIYSFSPSPLHEQESEEGGGYLSSTFFSPYEQKREEEEKKKQEQRRERVFIALLPKFVSLVCQKIPGMAATHTHTHSFSSPQERERQRKREGGPAPRRCNIGQISSPSSSSSQIRVHLARLIGPMTCTSSLQLDSDRCEIDRDTSSPLFLFG